MACAVAVRVETGSLAQASIRLMIATQLSSKTLQLRGKKEEFSGFTA
jgi:hypothetical protein